MLSLDPIHASRRARIGVTFAGAAAALVTAAWAFAPLPESPIALPDVDPPTPITPPSDPISPLDRSAFLAAIWRTPPAPIKAAPSDPAPAPAPPPPKLQLLAILHERGAADQPLLRAALYDPDTDRLHIVGQGDRIGARSVSGIGDRHVEVNDGRTRHRIELPPQGELARGGKP